MTLSMPFPNRASRTRATRIAGKESCEDPNNKKDRGDDNDDDNDNDEKGNNGGNAKEKGVQPTTDDPTYKYTDEKGENRHSA